LLKAKRGWSAHNIDKHLNKKTEANAKLKRLSTAPHAKPLKPDTRQRNSPHKPNSANTKAPSSVAPGIKITPKKYKGGKNFSIVHHKKHYLVSISARIASAHL
jgi:hypothetical protein